MLVLGHFSRKKFSSTIKTRKIKKILVGEFFRFFSKTIFNFFLQLTSQFFAGYFTMLCMFCIVMVEKIRFASVIIYELFHLSFFFTFSYFSHFPSLILALSSMKFFSISKKNIAKTVRLIFFYTRN